MRQFKRNKMKIQTLITVIVYIILTNTSIACSSSAGIDRANNAFKDADAVFYAKITKTELIDKSSNIEKKINEDLLRVHYEIIEVFKSTPPNHLISATLDMCGFGFIVPGFKYIIYSQKNKELGASIVMSSSKMMRDDKDYQKIRGSLNEEAVIGGEGLNR